MNVGNRAVKMTAKTALKGNMLRSAFTVAITAFVWFIGVYLSYLSEIAFGDVFSAVFCGAFVIFLFLPLFCGVLRFFWRILFGVKDAPVSVFYYFTEKKLYMRALSLIFGLILKAVPPALVLAIPTVGLKLVSMGSIFELADMSIPLWTANLSYIYSFMCVLCIVILILYMLKFYMAPLLLVSDESMDPAECLHMSAMLSKKNSLDFISLIISLIGWILISVTVIPIIFTLPYIITSYAVHFRFAVADYNKHISGLDGEPNVFAYGE